MALVLPVVERAPGVAQRGGLAAALRLEHEARVEEHLARVRVYLAEPRAQRCVAARVLREGVARVEHHIQAAPAGEALQQRAELARRLAEGGRGDEGGGGALRVRREGLGVRGVGLDGGEEPLDRGLVVVVSLAFDDRLRAGAG